MELPCVVAKNEMLIYGSYISSHFCFFSFFFFLQHIVTPTNHLRYSYI